MRERANDAFEPDVHLAFDERFGHGEFVALHESLENLLPGLACLVVFFLRFEIFLDFFAQVGKCGDATGLRLRRPLRIRRSNRGASFP